MARCGVSCGDMAYVEGTYGELQRICDMLAARVVNPPPMSKYPDSQQGLMQRMGDLLQLHLQQPTSGVASSYAHAQEQPSTVWMINHNLGRWPSIQLTDTGGAVIDGEVVHVSTTQAVATFAVPVAGSALCT